MLGKLEGGDYVLRTNQRPDPVEVLEALGFEPDDFRPRRHRALKWLAVTYLAFSATMPELGPARLYGLAPYHFVGVVAVAWLYAIGSSA